MMDQFQMSSQVIAGSSCAEKTGASGRLRVLLFDLLPTVPYYTGHLSAALSGVENIDVTLGAATYPHDHSFFRRMGVQHDWGLLDVAYRVRFAPLRRMLKLLEYLLNMVALALRFVWSRPDVMHVQFVPLAEHRLPFELWFLKLAHSLGIKLVYTVHNVLPHESSIQQAAVYRKLYRLVDQFVCHDPTARDRLVNEFEIDPTRIAVIPHGPLFTAERSNSASRQTLRSSGHCVVLCQGIMRPYKGIPFLLRAWKAACDAGLQASLWIVGTGDKRLLRELVEDAAGLGIASSVHFDFRFVSLEELAGYHSAADILVYPYTQITGSGALMTAVGYEKALIASDLPAFRQILHHGQDALLVPPGDLAGWSAALLRLAEDPILRARLARGLEGCMAVTPGWSQIASQTSRVYRQLVPLPVFGKS